MNKGRYDLVGKVVGSGSASLLILRALAPLYVVSLRLLSLTVSSYIFITLSPRSITPTTLGLPHPHFPRSDALLLQEAPLERPAHQILVVGLKGPCQGLARM